MVSTRSISLTYLLLLTICLGVLPERATAQQPMPDHSPLETAWYLAIRPDAQDRPQSDALTAVARTYLRLGHRETALRVAESIPPNERSTFAVALFAALMKSSNRDHAGRVMLQTWQTLREQEFGGKGEVGLYVTKDLITLDQLDRAGHVAESIDDDSTYKIEALAAVAVALIRPNENERAEALLQRALSLLRAVSEEDQYWVLRSIGGLGAGFAAAGDRAAANETLELALRYANNRTDSNRDRCRGFVAVAMAQAGQFERAVELADSLDEYPRVEALTGIAKAYTAAGRRVEAVALLDRTTRILIAWDDGEYAQAFPRLEIIKAYLAAGAPEAAEPIAAAIYNGHYTQKAALAIADWYIRAGKKPQALAVLDRATRRLSTMVSEKSEDILPAMSGSRAQSKSTALAAVVRKYLELKEPDRALAAIEPIDQPQYQADLLADLARSLVTANQPRRARMVLDRARKLALHAPEYNHDYFSELAIANIAGVYGLLNEPEISSRLFQTALDSEHVTESYNQPALFLAEIGFYFDQAKIKPDARIKRKLRALAEPSD